MTQNKRVAEAYKQTQPTPEIRGFLETLIRWQRAGRLVMPYSLPLPFGPLRM
jgi:hypothetical protein